VLPDGILYASRESHYSIFKAARMYRMECEKVETLNSGEIDCDDFKAKLLRHQDKPAIINVNIGKFLYTVSNSPMPPLIFSLLVLAHRTEILQVQL